MSVASTGTLHHTCFLVNDVEATATALSESMGIGPWAVFTIEPTEGEIRGESAAFSFHIAIAEVGGGSYELLSPHKGESVYTEHLARHGEGFHHTCLAYPTLEAMLEAKAELVEQGRELVQWGRVGDAAEFAYFMIPEVGSVVELLYLGELPPPEKMIG